MQGPSPIRKNYPYQLRKQCHPYGPECQPGGQL
jgi:hypothetical protein